MIATTKPDTITSLATLQFGAGGLLNTKPVDGYAVHLVRRKADGGTPGPTLCDIDRFAPGSAGWSVGGGVSGPGVEHVPCSGCAEAARTEFPGLRVYGLGAARQMADELGVEVQR